MNNTPTNAIVVAVGPDGHDAAVAFAVAEARRTERPLHVVHVLERLTAYSFVSHDGIVEAARATLDEATAQAERLAGQDVEVTSELVTDGWIVDELVKHTEGASLLVLEHRALTRANGAFGGSTVHSVAGRARVPVISVPKGWLADGPVKGVVTAAVQDATEAAVLLRAGFVEAEARQARLVVLHAWWLSSGYDVVVVDDAMREEYEKEFRQELEPVLAPLRAEHPGVDVEVIVRHGPRVEAVLDAGEVSDLLVLARRHHLLPLGSHLGPVARAALGHSTSPVLVTPEAGAPAAQQYSEILATIGRRPEAAS
ncbi:MAG TPA: universal stress protein [Nocardioides sp.]|uniref:universal stress protein n=1 Tax=Nocardioides sp. TaxID=35761 RepID=UPI002E31490C|nr:universal stress protein [Nocardioides sp.]HEX5087631.1 universal stress protein [Nocardioides sp.]